MNPILTRIPMSPPKNADTPSVIQPHNSIGGVPKTGIHHENQRNNPRTMIPIKRNNRESILVFPPEKYTAKRPIIIDEMLKVNISNARKK
jgi:hypothetical protein